MPARLSAATGLPARRNAHPERDFQSAEVQFLRWCLPPGSIVFAVENGAEPKGDTEAARNLYQQRRIESGILPGIPDIHVYLPFPEFAMPKCPRGIFMIENKSRLGTLRERQRTMHAELRDGGVPVMAQARTLEEVVAWIKLLGVPVRGHLA